MKTASVIIPCYNAEAFIDRAISSIFNQDYPCVELIVVDDGSTDLSKEKILSWKQRFLANGWKLIYFYQENKGPGGAINAGLKLVTGEYLSLLDADDEYLPGAIKERADYLDAHPECNVVRSNGWVVKATSKYLFVNDEREKEYFRVFEKFLKGETNNWAGGYMVRTEPLFQFYPNREIYTSRYGQNLQLLLPLTYGKPCGFVDKPFMNYIQQENSLSQTKDKTQAQKRDIENAEGYRDIRIYMTKLVVKDPDEQKKYLTMVEEGYWRAIMRIAESHRDEELLFDAYRRLCKVGKPYLTDRVSYYRKTCPALGFVLRVLNKLICTVRK